MNVLYFKAGALAKLSEHTIYTDLLKQFQRNGHVVYAIAALERRTHEETGMSVEEGIYVLRVKTGNITKCGLLEKGISMLQFERQYIRAIKKFFSDVKFDLVLYSTPPITAVGVVEYVKKRDNAFAYLMLKDIFPQNAVDLGMMSSQGFKAPIYKYFRKKERRLYEKSDYIGCMSEANIQYIVKHNPLINIAKIGICKNAIEPIDMSVDNQSRERIRRKYGIPEGKTVFIYGGNLGKPQGIPFMIECLKMQSSKKSYFLIVGDGTEFDSISKGLHELKIDNVKLLKRLPKEDYDSLVGACDVGLIYLDYRFTIPNYPSRLLSYLQAKVPVYALTDEATDIGRNIVKSGIGWWTPSNNVDMFCKTLENIENMNLQDMKCQTWRILQSDYNVADTYQSIINIVEAEEVN